MNVAEGVLIVGLCTVPLSIAIAILKYRLYDIDVVIKKTVIFALVAGAATVLYLLVAVLIPTAIIGLGSGAQTWAVLIGVAIGLSILPIRDRARRFADRLVYGKRATPYEVLEEFSGRMSGAYATDDVLPRMARILRRGGRRGACTGVAPYRRRAPAGRALAHGGSGAGTRPHRGRRRPALGGDSPRPCSIRVSSWAALRSRCRQRPMNPERERLIHGLAAQAGWCCATFG